MIKYINPVQLRGAYKGTDIGFVATYWGKLGVTPNNSGTSLFHVYSEDSIIKEKMKSEGFLIVLDEPINTFVESGTEKMDATPEQIELMNWIYAVIHEGYPN